MDASPERPPDLASQPLTRLKGVGEAFARRLERLGLVTVQDLLFHLPLRYEDRTRVRPLGGLRHGDTAVVEGEVEVADVVFGRRRSLLVRINDGTGFLTLRFFYFTNAQKAALTRGARLRCYGEVRQGPHALEMVHPEYRKVAADAPVPVEDRLTPVYPVTEGVTQARLRGLVDQVLPRLEQEGVAELLPEELLRRYRLPPLAAALAYVHRPPPDAPLEELAAGRHPAQQRLAFEELLAHQVSLRQLRAVVRARRAPVLGGDGALRRRFLASLPFTLTGAQARVNGEIAADLGQPHPMLRLVQGDVGSGKTVVAAAAVLAAVEGGRQAAVMAPTELLAEQHFRNFSAWLEPLGVACAWLSGRLKGKAREAVIAAMADGAARVVVGTHALFQAEVRFADLGLVVVDEQHRFGVHQRLALHEKGKRGRLSPHQLIMTATPIPRTLAQTAYADLDVSVIDELPPGRTPVTTVVVPDTRREEVMERVRAVCREGRQAYWVCTLIEESEALQCQAAEETHRQLVASFPDLRVGLVHGRMKPAEKEAAMAAFQAGGTQLLVATTVIEVGVDVPNATLMIIENAERLGLAQLHQLRGRVGRGAAASHCVLMYHAPLTGTARARLQVLRDSGDGFLIARKDLEIRGPGELLGTRQTGMLNFRIADVLRDRPLLDRVARAAGELLARHPDRAAPLVRRWLGDGTRYGGV